MKNLGWPPGRASLGTSLHVVCASFAVAVMCLCGSASAKTVYVNASAPVGTNDGSTWNNAYLTVTAGVAAAVSGDEVWVAAGTYTGLNLLNGGVALYGGFAGTETAISQRNWKTNPTVLDGGAAGAAVTSAGAAATLDGFTLRNPDSGGAVISLPSGSTTITDCVIQKDQGNFGIEVQEGATGVVSRCTLVSTASNTAVYNMGTITLANCLISGWSNGVYSENTGAVTVSNCTITRNDVGINTRGGTASISNCIVVGALYGIVLNGTFALSHNDVWGGSNGNYGGVDPGDLSGSISADPMFVNSAAGDFHLLASSPCIDTGNDTAVAGTTDLDGMPRIRGPHVNLGAFENPIHLYVDANATAGTNDGKSWGNAYLTVSAALAVVQGEDEVWVAAGMYYERISLATRVALYGGFKGIETARSQRDWKVNVTSLESSGWGEVVESLVSGATFDGFKITNDEPGSNGVSVGGGSLTMSNCALNNNNVGVSVSAPGTANILNCTFTGNSVDVLSTVNGVSIIANCTMTGSFYAVQADTGGAAIITNCSIIGTTNGVNVQSGGSASVSNSILAHGWAAFPPDACDITLSHNDVSGNSGGNYPSWLTPDVDSISADPMFVNSAGGDYHLQDGSPCKDAGDDTAVISTADLAGNPRIKAAHVDMGAYEIGNRVYVNQNAPIGTNNGTSWPNAFLRVGEGVTGAQSGDEVWVASGAYGEHVTVAKDLALYGGFTGIETARDQRNWAANATIVSGGGTSGYVVTLSATYTVLDGFTVRDNAGSLAGLSTIGGMAAIANCTFTANSSGVGVIGGTTTFNRCTISSNAGFGVVLDAGGKASFTACTFSANSIAGIFARINSVADVSNCTFSGGLVGIASADVAASLAVTNSTITGSTMAGVYVEVGTAAVSNCILASNATGFRVSNDTTTVSHNNVWSIGENYSGVAPDEYSISADPLFVNAAGGDFHLLAASPCIDAGDDSAVVGTTDLDGNPRLSGAHVDIGATESFPYEFATYPGRTLTSPTGSVDGVVYFGDSSGYLHAVDTATRALVFNVDIKLANGVAPVNPNRKALGRLTRWVLAGQPRIFCVTSDNYLMVYALDGTPVWSATLPGVGTAVNATAMVYNDGIGDCVYVATSDGTEAIVSKVSADGSESIASLPFPGATSTSPVSVYGGSVYFSTPAGSFRLAASDLSVLNMFGAGTASTAPPFIAATQRSPVAIIVTTGGIVSAYSAITGATINGFGSSGSVDLSVSGPDPKVTAAPFVYGDLVYVGGMDNKVYRVGLTDGAPAGVSGTTVFLDAGFAGEGSITAGIGICPYGIRTLVFGSTNGRYYASNLAQKGTAIAVIESPINSAPAYDAATQTICIAADNGSMYQLPAALPIVG